MEPLQEADQAVGQTSSDKHQGQSQSHTNPRQLRLRGDDRQLELQWGRMSQFAFQDSNLSPALPLFPQVDFTFGDHSISQQNNAEFAPLRAYPDITSASELSEHSLLSEHPLAQETDLSSEGTSSFYRLPKLRVPLENEDRQKDIVSSMLTSRQETQPGGGNGSQAKFVEDDTFFLRRDVPAQHPLQLLQKDVGIPSGSSSVVSSACDTSHKRTGSSSGDSKSTKDDEEAADQSTLRREVTPGETSHSQQQRRRPEQQPFCDDMLMHEVPNTALLDLVIRTQGMEHYAPPEQSWIPCPAKTSVGQPDVSTGPKYSGSYTVEVGHRERDLWCIENQSGIDGSYLGFLPPSQSTPGFFSAPAKSSVKILPAQLCAIVSTTDNSSQSSAAISSQPVAPVADDASLDKDYSPFDSEQGETSSANVQTLPSLTYMQKVDAWRANHTGQTTLFDSLALQGFSGVSPKKKAYDAVSESLNRILSQHVKNMPPVSSVGHQNISQSPAAVHADSSSHRRGEAVGRALSDNDDAGCAPLPPPSSFGRSHSHSSLSTVVTSVQKGQLRESTSKTESSETPEEDSPLPVGNPQPAAHLGLGEFRDVSFDEDMKLSNSQGSHSREQSFGISTGASSVASLEVDNFFHPWGSKISTPPPTSGPRELNIEERIPMYLHNLGIDQSPSAILNPFAPRGPIREPEFSPTELCTIKGSIGTPTKSSHPSDGDSPQKGDFSRSSLLSVDSTASLPLSIDSLCVAASMSVPSTVSAPLLTNRLTYQVHQSHHLDKNSYLSALHTKKQDDLENNTTIHQNTNLQRGMVETTSSSSIDSSSGTPDFEAPAQVLVEQHTNDSSVKSSSEMQNFRRQAGTIDRQSSPSSSSVTRLISSDDIFISHRKKTCTVQTPSLSSSGVTATQPLSWPRSPSDSLLAAEECSSSAQDSTISSGPLDHLSRPALTTPVVSTSLQSQERPVSSTMGLFIALSQADRRAEPEGCSSAPSDSTGAVQPPVIRSSLVTRAPQPSPTPVDVAAISAKQQHTNEIPGEGSFSPATCRDEQEEMSDKSSESSLTYRVVKLLESKSGTSVESTSVGVTDQEESPGREWHVLKEVDIEDRLRIEEIKKGLLLRRPISSSGSTDTESSGGSGVPGLSAQFPPRPLLRLGSEQIQAGFPFPDQEALIQKITETTTRSSRKALTSITIATCKRSSSSSPCPSESPAPDLSPVTGPLSLSQLCVNAGAQQAVEKDLPQTEEEDYSALTQMVPGEAPSESPPHSVYTRDQTPLSFLASVSLMSKDVASAQYEEEPSDHQMATDATEDLDLNRDYQKSGDEEEYTIFTQDVSRKAESESPAHSLDTKDEIPLVALSATRPCLRKESKDSLYDEPLISPKLTSEIDEQYAINVELPQTLGEEDSSLASEDEHTKTASVPPHVHRPQTSDDEESIALIQDSHRKSSSVSPPASLYTRDQFLLSSQSGKENEYKKKTLSSFERKVSNTEDEEGCTALTETAYRISGSAPSSHSVTTQDQIPLASISERKTEVRKEMEYGQQEERLTHSKSSTESTQHQDETEVLSLAVVEDVGPALILAAPRQLSSVSPTSSPNHCGDTKAEAGLFLGEGPLSRAQLSAETHEDHAVKRELPQTVEGEETQIIRRKASESPPQGPYSRDHVTLSLHTETQSQVREDSMDVRYEETPVHALLSAKISQHYILGREPPGTTMDVESSVSTPTPPRMSASVSPATSLHTRDETVWPSKSRVRQPLSIDTKDDLRDPSSTRSLDQETKHPHSVDVRLQKSKHVFSSKEISSGVELEVQHISSSSTSGSPSSSGHISRVHLRLSPKSSDKSLTMNVLTSAAPAVPTQSPQQLGPSRHSSVSTSAAPAVSSRPLGPSRHFSVSTSATPPVPTQLSQQFGLSRHSSMSSAAPAVPSQSPQQLGPSRHSSVSTGATAPVPTQLPQQFVPLRHSSVSTSSTSADPTQLSQQFVPLRHSSVSTNAAPAVPSQSPQQFVPVRHSSVSSSSASAVPAQLSQQFVPSRHSSLSTSSASADPTQLSQQLVPLRHSSMSTSAAPVVPTQLPQQFVPMRHSSVSTSSASAAPSQSPQQLGPLRHSSVSTSATEPVPTQLLQQFVPLRHSSLSTSPAGGVYPSTPPDLHVKRSVLEDTMVSTTTETSSSFNRVSTSARPSSTQTRDVPTLLSYKPSDSEELFYFPQTEADALTQRSDTTMESSHPGSDDAVPPQFSREVLGHKDLGLHRGVTIVHKEGIYSKSSASSKMEEPSQRGVSSAVDSSSHTTASEPSQPLSPDSSSLDQVPVIKGDVSYTKTDRATSPVHFIGEAAGDNGALGPPPTDQHLTVGRTATVLTDAITQYSPQQSSSTLDHLWNRLCEEWRAVKSPSNGEREKNLLERLERLARLIHSSRSPEVRDPQDKVRDRPYATEERPKSKEEMVTTRRESAEDSERKMREVVPEPSKPLAARSTSEEDHLSPSETFSQSEHIYPAERDESEILSASSDSISSVDTARLIRVFGARRVQRLKTGPSLSKLYSTIDRQRDKRESRGGWRFDDFQTLCPRHMLAELASMDGSMVRADSLSTAGSYTSLTHPGHSALTMDKAVKVVCEGIQAGDLEIVITGTQYDTKALRMQREGVYPTHVTSTSPSPERRRALQKGLLRAQGFSKSKRVKPVPRKTYPAAVSWFISAENLRGGAKKENEPEEQTSGVKPSTSWFEPHRTGHPWRQPLKQIYVQEDQTPSTRAEHHESHVGSPGKADSSSLSAITLQEALQMHRPNFIARSQERVKCLLLQAADRRQMGLFSIDDQELFHHHRMEGAAGKTRVKRAVPRREMIQRSKQIYNKLPEVLRRKEDEKRKAQYHSNRLKAQLFNKRITTHVLGRQVVWY